MTFTDMEYAGRKRYGKQERFLDSMEEIIPWAEFIKIIKPFYPKSGATGRQQMRTGVVQSGGRGESIYDNYVMRKFMRLDWKWCQTRRPC
jgi:IS5 family transposase